MENSNHQGIGNFFLFIKNHRIQIIQILILVMVIGLTIFLLSIRDQIRAFDKYSYPGLFVISVLTNATLIIPLPGVVITSFMGAIWDPFWVAIATGTGSAVGELTGYLAGFSGRSVVEKTKIGLRLEEWMKKFGDWVILVLAIIPNPFFDMAGITAGALRLPWYRFLMWCAVGKIIKMLCFAYGGSTIFSWIHSLRN